jgi:hypothetical protein
MTYILNSLNKDTMTKTTYKIEEYIRLSQERKLVLWRLSQGEWYFKHRGNWIEKSEFNKYYPRIEYKPFNDKGENPDWKKNL